MIAAGDLDRRIVLESRISDSDAGGAPVPVYATIGTVWANYKPVSGKEVWSGAGPTPQQEAQFHIRFSLSVSGLKAKDRLIFEGRSWDITDVEPVGRRDGLLITATLRNANKGTA